MLGIDKETLSLFSVGLCVAMHYWCAPACECGQWLLSACIYLIKSLQIDGMTLVSSMIVYKTWVFLQLIGI
jgi:hypothetical protein